MKGAIVMINNLKFEGIKLVKSRTLIVSIALFFGLVNIFIWQNNHRYHELYETHRQELHDLVRSNESEKRNAQDHISYTRSHLNKMSEKDAVKALESIEELNHLITFNEDLAPDLKVMYDAFLNENYLDYYASRKTYLEKEQVKRMYIEENIKNQSIDELVEEHAQQTPEIIALDLFAQADEPIEFQKASLAPLNLLILFMQFFRLPFLLLLMIITANLYFADERNHHAFMRQETTSITRWVWGQTIITDCLFLILFLASMALLYGMSLIFDDPLFYKSPSIYAPVLFEYQVLPHIHLGQYMIYLVLTLFILYLFLGQIFRLIIAFDGERLVQVPIFLGTILLAYYGTKSIPSLQNWWNPWQLFFFEHYFASGDVLLFWINFIVTVGLFFLISQINQKILGN